MKLSALEIAASIKPISHWASGEASFKALTQIKQELATSATENNCRILITDLGTIVSHIRYFDPHTFLISGHDYQGNAVDEVLHYSQLRIRVIQKPEEVPASRPIGFRLDRE